MQDNQAKNNGPIAFTPQQLLRERASILHYTHFVCLVSWFVSLAFTFLSPVCFH